MIRISREHNVDSLFIYGLAVLSILILSNVSKQIIHLRKGIYSVVSTPVIEKKPLFDKSVFNNLKIVGRAYVIYDITNREIISEKNATTTLPLASLTKIMTAITAYNHFEKNKKITITPKDIDGDYDLGLKNGQVWTLNELLKYTLVFSSNDGAQAIADTLGGRKNFVSLMNSDAKIWGLSLVFTQPAGLDEDGKIGGLGSALDIAKLFSIARKQFPEVLDATTRNRVSVTASNGRIIGIPNTNQDIQNISGAEASKTGYTDLAGGNLVIIADITLGHPIAIVVLGSTHEGRFSDVELLYKTLKSSISN